MAENPLFTKREFVNPKFPKLSAEVKSLKSIIKEIEFDSIKKVAPQWCHFLKLRILFYTPYSPRRRETEDKFYP
ncbi:MAG: hypothetical protein E7232_14430 [Lachnospiraceae bacterium]|nr:hypothetical protein [Lachnospiraceae bacterium]